MKAGRELDTLVAEKLMGWELADLSHHNYGTIVVAGPPGATLSPGSIPCYSTDIGATWEVVEKLRADEYEVDIRVCYSTPHKCAHPWSVYIVESGVDKPFGRASTCHAESAPLAICLAALKVKGIEVE